MPKMQIFPTESLVVYRGVEVIEQELGLALLPEWRSEPRILIQDDGRILVGLNPARPHDGGLGLGLMDEIAKLPAVAQALAARAKALAMTLDAVQAEAIDAARMVVHPMAVIAKKSGIYWSPTMPGYEIQHFDAAAGDRLYSRGVDAEKDGYRAGSREAAVASKKGRR